MAVTLADAFAERLRLARKAAGISQEELAFRAEIHRTQVSLMESGQRLPRLETFVKLAGAVGLGASELLGPIRWDPGVRTAGALILGEDE
jgi:transcriptional regulator with XRE-family HTH domain